MRLAVLAMGLFATAAAAQTPRYWPQLDIGFPVPQAVLELSPKPAKLRLYAAGANGRFEKVSELAIDRLQAIPNRKPGFQYTARGDGEEEFAVQLVYGDGTVSPSDEKLKAEFKVVFDTRPPTINLSSLGSNGVQWTASDENLDSASVRLECRWAGSDTRWHEVKKSFGSRDEYTWASLAREKNTLEVRVTAKDKAGHEAVSRIIKLPDSGGGNKRDFDTVPLRNTDTGAGRDIDSFPNSTSQIVYVNRHDLQIRSKLTHVTRSGISKVHLYSKDLSTSGGEWKLLKEQACSIKPESQDTTVEIACVVPKDGRYGFIVIPESGVGRREPEPRASAPPQQFVVVDTEKPKVKVRSVLVSAGGTIGPRIEVEWDADDLNLMPDPIVLEYAASKDAITWTTLGNGEKIPNSRRYVAELADKTLFTIFIRVRATDKATNVGEHVYEKPVIVDLDKPSATIDNIRGSGSAAPVTPAVERPSFPSSVPSINLPSVNSPELLPGK